MGLFFRYIFQDSQIKTSLATKMTESGRTSVNDYFLKYRNESTFNDKKSIQDCFKYFNANK